MNLRQCVDDYLAYLQHEQGGAKTTLKGYSASLNHFLLWAQENGYPNPGLTELSTPVLRRYLYSLSKRGLRPRTVLGYFSPLKAMSSWLFKLGGIVEDPMKALTLPKKDAPIRKVTSEEEIAGLLQACERQRNPLKVALSRAVLSTLIFSGLRRQELLDLYVTDIDLVQGSVLVRSGKGSKSRTVFVCNRCVEALREWIAVRKVTNGLPYLFTADCTRRLYYNGLKAILETVKTIAGFGDRAWIQPHSLRHAFGTRLLRNGADIRVVQAALGHSQLQTTAVYLHANEENVRAVRDLTDLRPSCPPGQAAQQSSKTVQLTQGQQPNKGGSWHNAQRRRIAI